MDDHRPVDFTEVIGQASLKERLTLTIKSCLVSNRKFPHTLFVAPPGCGKTSIAEVISLELLLPMEIATAPIDDRFLHVLIESGDCLVFLDEVHCLTRRQQEYLLPVIEDNVVVGKSGARFPVNVSVIAATTEGDKIIRPLWQRFRLRPDFEPYTVEELQLIVKQMASKYLLSVDDEWAATIAGATLNVPRNARAFVETARDLLAVHGQLPSADEVLHTMRITPTGLTTEHVRYMTTLHQAGDKAGLETMRQLLGMPSGHIEFLEVDLMKQQLLLRTGGGRELTTTARRWLREA